MLIKRTLTPRLLAACRSNGARSRGPVTRAGKVISALNSIRHGLFSTAAILPDESLDEFTALRDEFLASLNPRTFAESALAERMVAALWLQRRCRRIEFTVINARLRELFPGVDNYTSLHLSMAFSEVAGPTRILEEIGRFESRHERRFYLALDAFHRLREENTEYAVEPVISLETHLGGRRGKRRNHSNPDSKRK